MKDARDILRVLYQHVQTHANLKNLAPRPLLDPEIVAGASEFAVTGATTTPGGGMAAGGLIVRRTYSGYVAVHYPNTTNPGDVTPDEAALNAALESFRLNPLARVPGVVAFGGFGTTFRLNTYPEKVQHPSVLTMSADFDLTLDLETGVIP